ncbi:unnamed protein product [Rhizophagus irregularis]|uniref:Reverse transcriptase n=1 Tax=Rhizophagus irregularis TaxID=588596 RepID=A0A915ZPL5_9GLOM|nr:unnamed protein product [Rhizophagus irregularis]
MAKSVRINKHYTVFGIIDNAHINSTGIIILVKNDIANHVTDVQDHLGRIIKIDFNFSKYNKFSIIAIYNKSGNSVHASDSRQTLNQIVINLIKEARRKQQQIIFMGDFNLRFDRYEKLKNKRVRIKNQFSIFKYLENHEFIDVHKDFLNIDDQNLSKCYSTFQNYSTFSWIDYMWITNNLYDGVIKAKIIEYNSLDTDHSLLSIRFVRNNVIFQPIRTNKNIKAGRIKYLYEDLDEDSKKMIIDMTEKELDVRLKNYTPTNLDEKWNIYNHVIATIKKSHIKHKEIKIVVDKEDQDIKNTLEYRFYRYIVYIRRGLKKAKGLEQIKKNWKKIVRNLRSILKALEISVDFYILSYYFRIVLIDTYLKEIEELYSVAYISLNTEMGLPKKSTFEPLRIVNEIINYAEQNKKEMWFLMLDMSKAYNRINIPMLENAMRRIKLPEIIIKILTGLFTNRTNQVFTPFGLTDSFDMLTGIDQGEIISPLLWIIYYDPLLAKIRNTNLGFKMEAKEYIDVYENLYRLRSITFPGCAYMDDTGFITNNKNNLERILKIADSFYKLNDIKINKQKSELLLRKNISKKKPLDDIVKIKFGEDIIEVKPTHRNRSSRFLGVWINAFNNNSHVIQQIKDEISAIIKNISCRKGITDKMMIYLFNMLIIPIIEYRSQLYVIEENILDTKNAGLLIEYNIEGGPTPLRNVISDNVYIKNFNMLQENNLIFVDQITTLDKNYLLSIEEMELKRYTKLISTKRMSQEHRKSYERIIIDLSCSKISFKIKAQIYDNMLAIDEIYNLKGTILLPTTILPEKGATIVSRMTRGQFQNRTVFGRVIKTNVDSKIIYFNHFETLTDDFEKNIILRKCEGCELGTLNAEVFKKEVKSKCLIIERIDSTFLLSPNRWNKQHHSKRLQKNTYYYEGISANFYDEALRYNYAFNSNIIEHRLDNGRMFQYEVPISGDNIDKYLAKGNRYNIAYQRIKRIKDRIKLDSSNNIHIYIDGSVIDNRSENIKSIFGITIYDDKERLIDKYFSMIEQWLTSTKAETMAFFVALLLINKDKNFIIYTDSSNVIKNYELLTNKWLSTTTRDILKFDKNNAIWFNIKEILDSFTQQLDVIKVKSHSNNKLHNKLDEEIKGCYDMEDRLANTLVIYNTEQYKFPIMWNNYIIEMNLRRFIRLLTRTQGLEKFLNLNRNWRYRLLDVKWEIVFSYINKQEIGETTYKTDKFICKQKRMKIQRLIEEIPTIEQMKKSSYDIYQDFKCVFCYKKKEDFHHVWTCRHNRKILKQIIKRTIDKLIRLLKEYGASVDENKILTDINKFDIFFPKFRKDKFNFIDLIKGIFPKQLYDYIEKLEVIGKKNIVCLGMELLQYVMDETKQHIWIPRCEKLKIIEKRHGITEKDKKKSDSNVDKEKQEDILQHPINLFGRYEDLEGVKEYILFGKEILDFTVVVNRVGKI